MREPNSSPDPATPRPGAPVETVGFSPVRRFHPALAIVSLMRKESQRFVSWWHEMLLGPLVSTSLFLMIFEIAAGDRVQPPGGLSLLTFISAGLIAIAVVHSGYTFPAGSLIMKRHDGSITDDLMTPLSPWEFVIGHCAPNVLSSMATGAVVGLACWAATPLGPIDPLYLVLHAAASAAMLTGISLLVGLWADKWDKFAAVEGFVLWPMTFLSGAFYSVTQIPAEFAKILPFTPFFMLVDGFRYGVTGYSEAAPILGPWGGTAALAVLALMLAGVGTALVSRGYKLKF